jgi:TolA-binding protein
LTLYQDELEIPHVEKIIVAGEYCQDEMISSVSQAFPTAEVERFKFSDLLFSENLTEELSDEELASYIIPISLAWKTMATKQLKLLQTNFLEKKVVKSQKLVQFSWHSVLMLAILMVLSFSYTTSILDMQKRLNLLKENTEQKKADYENYRSQYDPGPNIQVEIDSLTKALSEVKSFYDNKAIWSHIFEKLSVGFAKYPTSWLTNIQGNDGGFTVTGSTTKRENIVKFSGLFPDGTIKSVQGRDYEDRTLWLFDISFSYEPSLEIVESWIGERSTPEIKNLPKESVKTETVISSVKKEPVVEMYRKVTDSYFNNDQNNLLKNAQKFIELYPDHILVTNCRYFMSEYYYRQGELADAEKLLDLVLKVKSPMEPYALFKISQIYNQTDRKNLARVNLNRLLSQFPESDVISRAKAVLKEIGGKNE